MSREKTNKNCFVCHIAVELAPTIEAHVREEGFRISFPSYTLFSAQSPSKNLSCTFYQSGKFLVQGKGAQEFIEFYLEPEILKNISLSHPELNFQEQDTIGSDESGKGDFFGPLCTTALYCPKGKIKELIELGVKDSKKLSDTTIVKMSQTLKKNFIHHSVVIFPEKYNELYLKFRNLNRFLAWCHLTAIGQLIEKTDCREVIVDQFAKEELLKEMFEQKKINVHLRQQVRAEEHPVVAAASIIARSEYIQGLDSLMQKYEIELSKGSGYKTLEIGLFLANHYGLAFLEKISKHHFQTFDQIRAKLSL